MKPFAEAIKNSAPQALVMSVFFCPTKVFIKGTAHHAFIDEAVHQPIKHRTQSIQMTKTLREEMSEHLRLIENLFANRKFQLSQSNS